MKFPPSQDLGFVEKDGREIRLRFRGEDEGTAVALIPGAPMAGGMNEMHVLYREDAQDADDARKKLTAWLEAGR